MADTIKILALGDVVGEAGLEKIRSALPKFKRDNAIDFCIVNGENSATGNGCTAFSCEHLFTSGADIITGGNHTYRHREFYETLDSSLSVLRPANYPEGCAGRGWTVADKGAYKVAVINLMGTVFTEPLGSPFECADRILEEIGNETNIIIVDFHAEATAEKKALGFYLDGRVSAVFGTHTHVQTSDEQILPDGTGYITDAGMTGPDISVIGVEPELAIKKMKFHMPVRFENAKSECSMQGILFEIDRLSGKTVNVTRIKI